MFAHPDSAVGFISTHFYKPYLFHRIPNSMRILYKTSFLTESQDFLKSINGWCTASLYSLFFLKYLTDAVCVISSCPDRRMLFRILYVVDKSDMAWQLLQSVLSPFLQIDTLIDSFHCWDILLLIKNGINKIMDFRMNFPASCFNQFFWDLISTW